MALIAAPAPAQQRDTPNSQKGAQVQNKIKNAKTSLELYEKDRDIQTLEQSVEHLEETELLALKEVAERLIARQDMLHTWCRVLQAIDSIKDPKFDPDDAPLLKVPPPFDESNPSMPASAAAQQQHQMAVAAKEEKKARRRIQFLARELDDRAVESAQRLVEKFFTKSAVDLKEIAAILAETNLSKARQAQLILRP
jgi:hypothetical protein